jgi:hypothetical protein
MPGLADYLLGALTILLEVGVVVCAIFRGSFRRYFTINLYMTASAVLGLSRFYILGHYGFASKRYFYFYYHSDALLTICLYFALMGLYVMVFEELKVGRYVRLATILLLGATALFSYAVVYQSSTRLLTSFVVEMSQNLYFVGLVLTYILWGAVIKMRETRTRLIQFVLSLGVYFSVFAAVYSLRNLYPAAHFIWGYTPPLMALLLPLAWAYAFWRVPEEARLAPSRLAVVPR